MQSKGNTQFQVMAQRPQKEQSPRREQIKAMLMGICGLSDMDILDTVGLEGFSGNDCRSCAKGPPSGCDKVRRCHSIQEGLWVYRYWTAKGIEA